MSIHGGGDLQRPRPFLSPMQATEVYVSSQGTCYRFDTLMMRGSVSVQGQAAFLTPAMSIITYAQRIPP